MINFSSKTVEPEGFPATLLEFEIEGGVCAPEDLKGLQIPELAGNQGVIISGRGPVWLYAHLVHHYHPSKWVATFDPRLGAVVVSVHAKDAPAIGQALSL